MSFCIFSSNQHYSWFLRSLVIGVALLLGAVAFANWLVDPYGIYLPPPIRGVNGNKPEFVAHLRLTHPYAIERLQPEGLILGTSRAGQGLSPTHRMWRGLNVYNAAYPSVSLYEMWRTLQHAQAIHPLRVVVLGLDNRVFYADRDGNGTFSEARMRVDAANVRQHNFLSARLPDLAASLLSTDALLSSLRTVRFQNWSPLTLGSRGEWTRLSDSYDYEQAFRTMTSNTFERYRKYSAEPFVLERAVEPLFEIMMLCHRERIDLKLLIPPAHAWHWEAMRIAGMQDRFDAIKRAIVATNQRAAKVANAAPYPVWDYSGYVGPNTEKLPETHTAKMHWFWETVHFKPALGDRILDNVLAKVPNTEPGRDPYGAEIDVNNIEQHLVAWRQAQRNYEHTHSHDLAIIEALHTEWQRRR